jgi:hypothetical protein
LHWEKDITSALRHNLEALASLRRQAEDAKVNSPVAPAQSTIVDAAPGHISSRLHPRYADGGGWTQGTSGPSTSVGISAG